MKQILLSFLFAAGILAALAEPIPNFLNYENVEFTAIEGDSAKFTHKFGAGKVKISQVPPELREKLKNLEKKEKPIEIQSGEIEGQIIQVLTDGVLIHAKGFKSGGKLETFPSFTAFILMDSDDIFDGKKMKIFCYAAGNITYDTKSGEEKTVRLFTTDIEVAKTRVWLKEFKKEQSAKSN